MNSPEHTESKGLYGFGDFVLDPAGRELKKDGQVVDIEPRAFDVLVFLVNNRDRAVNKDELQDAVWPGMIVTETALTRAVMKARKAVDDDATTQAVIKTLHGHGYRFIADLIPSGLQEEAPGVSPVPLSEVSAQDISAVPSAPWLALRSAALLSLALLSAAILAWLILRSPPIPEGDSRIAVLPLLDTTENPELAWSSLGLMSYVAKLIATDGGLSVVPEGNVVGMTTNFSWSGMPEDPTSRELIAKLRHVYGASHILTMQLETEGRSLRMNYALTGPDGSPHKGTIVGDEATNLAQGVVQSVYGIILRRSRLDKDYPLVSKDPFNNEAFARGMGLSLGGRCVEAVPYFKVIIEQEPDLFAPRFEYAACLRILGEWQEAETLLLSLIEEQRPLGDIRPMAQALMTLGILYDRTGRLDLAQEAHEEALRISDEIGDRELSAKILQNLSIVYEDRSQYEAAGELLDLAVLAYRDAGREILPGQLYSGKANLAMDQGELVEAEGYLEQALAAFREIGDRRNEAMMLNNTGYLRRRQGRLDEAEDYHLRSLAIREEIGDRVGVGRIYGMLSVVYSSRGEYEQAIQAAQQAREIAHETADRLFEATSLAQMADAEKAMGDLESARGHYLEGKAVFQEIQDRDRALQSDLKLAELDLMEGRFEKVETTALLVLEESREYDFMTSEVRAMELLGDLEIARGETDAAIAEYKATLARVSETTWTAKENTLVYKLANAYMDQAELQLAAPLVGVLVGHEPNVQSLKTQARFAFLRADSTQAVKLMSDAKEMSGENWSAKSEETLQNYIEGN
jgi:DNA-binding winged helix-turn-helix (wHTH) protein/tetratricopeptide (TPR) repeat protein